MSVTGRIYSALFICLFCVALALFLHLQRPLLSTLANVGGGLFLFLLFLRSLFIASNGLVLRQLTRKFGIVLTPGEWLGLAFATSLGNFIIPFSGGMVARAAYLKHRHNLSFIHFSALQAATYLVYFWVLGATGGATLLFLRPWTGHHLPLILLFGVMVGSASLVILLPPRLLSGTSRLAAILNRAVEGWTLVKEDRRLLVQVGLYSLVNLSINSLCFCILYGAFQGSPFAGAFLVGLLAMLAPFLSITPGNLGIQELIAGASSALLGMGAGTGVLITILLRFATLIPALVGGSLFSLFAAGGIARPQGPTP